MLCKDEGAYRIICPQYEMKWSGPGAGWFRPVGLWTMERNTMCACRCREAPLARVARQPDSPTAHKKRLKMCGKLDGTAALKM